MTTETRVVFGLALAGLAGFAALTAHAFSGAPSPDATLIDVKSQNRDRVVVQFAGDTMLADAAGPSIDKNGWAWPLAAVRPLLTGDFTIVNAEAPFTNIDEPADPSKKYTYNVPPQGLAALKAAGVDAINLANNHVMDRGVPGLRDTLKSAGLQDVASVGAGEDIGAAQKPLLIRTSLGTLGITSMGEYFGKGSKATEDSAGIPVLEVEQATRSLNIARAAGADWVIAFVHWGDNYQPINIQQRAAARVLHDAGYSAVIGSGSHVTQPVEMIGSMPVVYSMGNFVFGAPGRFASFGANGTGLIVSLTVSKDEGASLSLQCISTDNATVAYQPRPCSRASAVAALQGSDPRVTIDAEGVGHLDVLFPARN